MPPNTSPSSDHEVAVLELAGVAEPRERTRIALRDALRAGERGAVPDGEMRRMLRHACGVARAHGTRVEEVLVLLKEAWRALPGARGRRDAEAQARLARVVTMCIEEYYGAPPRQRCGSAALDAQGAGVLRPWGVNDGETAAPSRSPRARSTRTR